MSTLFRSVPAAAIALLLLTSCAQISVTGPCEVQSDSSITLNVEWAMQSSAPLSRTPAGKAAVMNVMTKLNGVAAARPFQISAQAAGESILVVMEVPSTWSETAVVASIDGAPATPTGSDEPAYCGEFMGAARAGYERRFYQIPLTGPVEESIGTLQVTYATGTIADGVYHPAVMLVVEPEDGEVCIPQASFHRVTAGTLKFVPFDLTASFNADTVVNGTDVEQDALIAFSDGETTSRLAFATDTFLGGEGFGLPDDGLLTPERFALQAEGTPLMELPECLPSMQLGWSETSDGFNSWVQQAEPVVCAQGWGCATNALEDETLVIDVPDAQYAELLLYVTPGASDPSSGDPFDALLRAMRVEMTYDDASTSQVATLLPVFGLPVALPALAADAPDLVPSFTMGVSMLAGTDGTVGETFPFPAGIAAMLVTPDSTRRLVSVRITPFLPEGTGGPVLAARRPRSQAALEPVKMAVYGAAGMQLVPNVAVAKSLVTPAPYVLGNDVTYRVTVSNTGNATTGAVTVTDTLDPALAFVSVAPSTGTCNEAAGVVTCSLGELAPGAVEAVDIVARITAVGPFSNTASASMEGEEDDTSDNTATVAAVALGIPNLAIVKTAETPGPYIIGSDVSYRLAVTNDGTGDSTAVTMTDALPSSLAFVSAVPSTGTCGEAGGTVTCSLGALAAGASATVDIVATINAVGPITNTGTASMEGGEADLSDNSGSVTIAAEGIANLALAKTVTTPSPHILGNQVTYRLTVTNDGTADSTAVTISDALPPEVAFVSVAPSTGTCGEAGGTVTCNLGLLAAGASATVDIVATINSVGSITNTGTASMTGEADLSDNTASVTIATDGIANLALGKSVETPAPYVLGSQVTYRLTVTNDGTADSTAVTMTDALPAGLAFVSVAPSTGTCSEAGGTVTCNLGVLVAGASATVDIVATIDSVGPITNTGTASMTGEADLSDNAASVTIATDGIANLALGKSVETPAPYVLGSQVTYRLTVTNDGTADSTAVTISDALPAGLAFASVAPSTGTCSEAGGTVTCNLGVLVAGASATVDIVATIDSVGPITNTGTASMTGEADLSDNTASVTIAAEGVANLAFAKSVETPAPYIVGSQVTYRLTVANDGTADSTGVTVTDTLPAGLAFVGVAPSTGTCSEAGGTITCSLGVLTAGASATVDIVATIMSAGAIVNTGAASMAGGEADLSDNSAAVTVTAEAAAIAGVPTTSEWALLLLASMLGTIALLRMRT